MAQDEAITFGRKNLVCAIIPTFVYPTNEEVTNSMQSGKEFDWISPKEFTRYSGVKINISGQGSGTSANIEVSKLDGVILRSKAALENCYISSGNNGTETDYSTMLETKISFVPNEFVQFRGKTANEIAQALDYNSAITIANNFKCEGRFAAANQRQKDALYLAAALKSLKDAVQPDFFDKYVSDPAAAIGNNQAVYQLVSYIEGNWAGAIAECGGKSTTESGSSVVIYDCPMKTPDIKRVDKQGYTKVYSFRISIDVTRDYPVHVEIHEGKGKPQTNHAVGIVAGTYIKVVDKTFDFTADEWLYALNTCKDFRSAVVTNEWSRVSQLASYQRSVSIQMQKNKNNVQTAPQNAPAQQTGQVIYYNPQQQYYQA